MILAVAIVGCGEPRAVIPDAGQSDGAIVVDVITDADPGSNDGGAGCSAPGVAGAIDTTFGEDGVVTFFGLEPGAAIAEGVAVDPDSQIVIVGYNTRTPRSCIVARLLPDGSSDPSFGTDGIVYQSVGEEAVCWYHDVVLQADGKIVAVGEINGHVMPRAVIARYLTNGELDLQFGVGGLVMFEQQHTSAMAVALDSAQRILTVGTTGSAVAGTNVFYTRRYLPDGTLDASFGVGGEAVPVFTESPGGAYGVGIQDDKVIVVGMVDRAPPQPTFAAARYTADGLLDPDFGSTGSVLALGHSFAAYDVRLDDTGQPVVLGGSENGGVLARLTDDGSLDPTFGGGTGTVFDPVTSYSGMTATIQDASLLVGTSDAGALMLGRYTQAGEIDTTFGSAGHAASVPLPWLQIGLDVAVQASGGIVVVGGYGDLTSFDMFAARYCP